MRALVKNFRRMLRTFGRRAPQRLHQVLQNLCDPPQRRRRDPTLRQQNPTAALVSFATSSTTQFLERGLRPLRQHCRRQYHQHTTTKAPHVCARRSCALSQKSCRGGCECVDTSEHNRIAHFVLVHHFVELCICLLDPVSIVTVDNIDQTVRILEVMVPQRADHKVEPQSLYNTVRSSRWSSPSRQASQAEEDRNRAACAQRPSHRLQPVTCELATRPREYTPVSRT